MTYDINAIKNKIAQLSRPANGKTNGKGKRSFKSDEENRLTYFKPGIGSVDVRFLPYDDGNGQPFQQVDYYDNKSLWPRRVVAPVQFGLPDPVATLLEDLSKDRQNDSTWRLMRSLRLKESHYAPILVRGKESLGVQVWEINTNILNQVYAILSHPDYADEYLFDPEKGYDFTVTASDSGKVFNSPDGKDYMVKLYDIQPRRKASALLPTAKEREALVAKIPNLADHFKKYVMGEEKLKEAVINMLQAKSEDGVNTKPPTEEESSEKLDEATSKIDEAFSDL
jgi:hypothetical protein